MKMIELLSKSIMCQKMKQKTSMARKQENTDQKKLRIWTLFTQCDGKPFFEILVRKKEEAHEQIIEMSRNNVYATGNLLDYEYFSKHYKLIAIDLSKQIELENPDLIQEINFIGRLERTVQQSSLLLRKKKKPLLIFHKIM